MSKTVFGTVTEFSRVSGDVFTVLCKRVSLKFSVHELSMITFSIRSMKTRAPLLESLLKKKKASVVKL